MRFSYCKSKSEMPGQERPIPLSEIKVLYPYQKNGEFPGKLMGIEEALGRAVGPVILEYKGEVYTVSQLKVTLGESDGHVPQEKQSENGQITVSKNDTLVGV